MRLRDQTLGSRSCRTAAIDAVGRPWLHFGRLRLGWGTEAATLSQVKGVTMQQETQQPSESAGGLSLYVRLSAMMFLEFAVWGAWSVMIAVHMGSKLEFTGLQIGMVFGTTAFGALLAPMIAGNIADRYMPSQIFTAISHLAGAVLLVIAWKMTTFPALWGVMFVYAMTYMPTIALTNGIAFKHMGDSEKFGNIRVWGTLGWIFIQMVVSGYLIKTQQTTAVSHAGDCLLIAAVVAAVMGIYSFTLPHTPPSKEASNPYAFLEAFKLTKNRNFGILLAVSFVVAIELPWYYNLTPIFFTQATGPEQAAERWMEKATEVAKDQGIAPPAEVPMTTDGESADKAGGLGLGEGQTQAATTIGQIAEISFMLLLFPMLHFCGMKWTVFFGILAWPLRYIAFSIGEPTVLVLGSQALHGAAYTFFFAAGMVAAERLAPKDIRASSQALMVFATNGLGMLVGHFLSGTIHDRHAVKVIEPWIVNGQQLVPGVDLHNWPGVFMLPIVVTIIAAVIFVALFNEQQFKADSAQAHADELARQETPVAEA